MRPGLALFESTAVVSAGNRPQGRFVLFREACGMPRIELSLNRKLIRVYDLETGPRWTIGRRIGSDILIEDHTVSKDHAIITYSEGKYLLADLKSSNGTFVNGTAVSSHWLENGDILSIGTYQLRFVGDEDETSKSKPDETVDTFAKYDLKNGQIAGDAGKAHGTSSRKIESEQVGTLSFVAGGRGEIKLTKESTTVGKDAYCDLVLEGILLGKIAFTIDHKPNGYYLKYVGGVSIPKVSGQPVRRSMKLENSDIIEIGSVKLQFSSGAAK
jgi:pSer/pThr/pTyr-binding forkhead associated (FHA) protein